MTVAYSGFHSDSTAMGCVSWYIKIYFMHSTSSSNFHLCIFHVQYSSATLSFAQLILFFLIFSIKNDAQWYKGVHNFKHLIHLPQISRWPGQDLHAPRSTSDWQLWCWTHMTWRCTNTDADEYHFPTRIHRILLLTALNCKSCQSKDGAVLQVFQSRLPAEVK